MILSPLLRPTSKDKIYAVNLIDSVVSKIENKLTNYGIFNGTCSCLGYRKFKKCKHLRMFTQNYRGLNTPLINDLISDEKNLIITALTPIINSGIIGEVPTGLYSHDDIRFNLIKIKARIKLPCDFFYYVLIEKKKELPILIY